MHETYFATKPVGRGRRRVVTVHDMISRAVYRRVSYARQVIAAKRAAVNRADHVICVSENTSGTSCVSTASIRHERALCTLVIR